MTKGDRGHFATKFGVLMATVGSAVGLGNIWRFPYQMGMNGGAAFLIVYILAVFLMGIPAMVAEFIIGRESHKNTVDAFNTLAPCTRWNLLGYLGVITGGIISCYYCVVVGWTLYYLCISASNSLVGYSPEQYNVVFNNFVTNPYIPTLFLVLVIVITGVIVSRGVQNGIERMSKIMMPMLFILLIVLGINSCMMPNAFQGLKFMFVYDASKLTFDGAMGAVGQAFYSLSLGMGCLITYSSYFKDNVDLPKTASQIAIVDLLVAVLSGVMIFPALFSLGMQPDEGAGLVFKVLPSVFSQMALGSVWAIMFYVLLFIAALTSFMSLYEVIISFVVEKFNITRVRACIIMSAIFAVMGTISSLSFGVLSDFTIFGNTIFDTFDYLSTTILLPFGGIFTSLFVGWRLDKKVINTQLNINSPFKFKAIKVYIFFLRFIIPIAILTMFVFSIVN